MTDIKPLEILILVCVNALGFFTFGLVFYAACFSGNLPDNMSEHSREAFFMAFFGGTMWAWIVSFLISIGYLFVSANWRKALLWAPVYVPFIYSVVALSYFN